VAQGVELLAASDDITAMGALVGVMSVEDLERGMELARLSGELRVARSIVRKMQMPVLAAFLGDRSNQLNAMAVDTVFRASGARALATALRATGKDLSELSAEEVAEGVTRLAASDALSAASEELAEEGAELAVKGAEELTESAALGDVARDLTMEGLAETSLATAELGAAAQAAQTQD
jgi:hypothetical protein